MIDQKLQPLKKNEQNDMVLSAMTTSSSSFTHLSMMDTDDISTSTSGCGEGIPSKATVITTTNANENYHCQNSETTPPPNSSHSFAMYDALVDICQNNIKYFECDETETGQRFLCAFRGIVDHIAIARSYVTEIVAIMHEYDFDESVPANGYRSYSKIMQACINHCVKICKYIAQNRSYLLFRKTMYMK